MIIFPDRVKLRSPFGESGRFRLPSFGEKLKQEREKRKITLEQISVSTKIGTRMLQALEENKFNQLPGGIFNKGFVRAYSRVVGLDEDQTVADYMQASGDAPPVSTRSCAPHGRRSTEHFARTSRDVHRLESISDTPLAPALGMVRRGPAGNRSRAFDLEPRSQRKVKSKRSCRRLLALQRLLLKHVPAPRSPHNSRPNKQTTGRPASSARSKSGAPTTVPQPSPSVRTSAPVAKATADLDPPPPVNSPFSCGPVNSPGSPPRPTEKRSLGAPRSWQ